MKKLVLTVVVVALIVTSILTVFLNPTLVTAKELKDGNLKLVFSEDTSYMMHEDTLVKYHDAYKFYLKPEPGIIKGEMELNYKNKADVTLDSFYFNIYPNAYKDRGGYLKIEEIKDGNGNLLNYEIFGKSDTLVEVKLREALKPGDNVLIEMNFEIGVARFEPYVAEIGLFGTLYEPLTMRFSQNNGTYYLGNALPIVCVYDGKWHNNDYSIAESFHSEFSYYDVTLDLPEDFLACTSGYLIDERIENNRKILHYTSDLLREFTIVLSNDFEILSEEWNGKTINIFYPKGKVEATEACLVGTKKVLETFSEEFGEYPYKTFNVVEHPMTAMEYPCLIMVPFVENHERGGNVARGDGLSHEISHQWWYATAGNNENDEPWLDEAFAVYSNALFNEWEYGQRSKDVEKLYLDYIKDGGEDVPVGSDVWSFPSEGYSPIVYKKGAAILNMLRYVVGDENFFKILREYHKEYKFELLTTEDFIKVCERVHGKDLDWFFDEWVYGTGYLNYKGEAKVEEKDGKYLLGITIRQKQSFRMPLDIKIVYEDGKEEYKSVVIANDTEHFEYLCDKKPASLTLDPDYYLIGEIERDIGIGRKMIVVRGILLIIFIACALLAFWFRRGGK